MFVSVTHRQQWTLIDEQLLPRTIGSLPVCLQRLQSTRRNLLRLLHEENLLYYLDRTIFSLGSFCAKKSITAGAKSYAMAFQE